MATDDMTIEELAELAECGLSTVRRAIRAGEIPGARRDVVNNSVAWLIPRETGKTWARKYIPFAAQKVSRPFGPHPPRTANIDPRTSPAEGSIPVTRDERPPCDGG